MSTTTTKPDAAQLPELSPLGKLLGALDAATIAGLGGGAAPWFKEAIRSGLQEQLGGTVTDADIDAGIDEVNKYNTASGQPGVNTPPQFTTSAKTAPAKNASQAAQQIAKRFGGSK